MGGSKDKSLSNPNGKLRILTVNADSVKGKAAEIASICDYVKPDIIAMSETKLDKSVNAAEFLPVNFQDNVIRKDRNLHGGGVLLAHREGLVVNPVSCKGIKNDCELVFSRVSMANGQPPLYIGAYYRSQIDNTANTSLDGLSSALSQVTELVGNSKATVILTGDFNCPDISWDSLSTKTGGKVIGVSEKLINVSTQYGLQQLQRGSTKLDSVLDLFFTSNVTLMSSIDTIPGISTDTEHEAIVVDLNLKAEITKSDPHRVYLWNKVKWDSIKAATSEFVSWFCAEASGKSVDEQWESIENHLTKMLKEFVPSKFTRRRTDQPWLSGDLKRRCRKKQRLYNRWKKLKSRKKPCKGAREAYKRYHHDTNNLLKKSRNQYINNILSEGLENKSQKSFWRYIKTQRTESSGVAPLKEKGQIHSDPGKKANILANQFRSVFTVDGPEAADTHLAGPSYPPMPDVTITETGVNKLLKGIDPGKASGPDQIPCRLLHELHMELTPAFTFLFQASYDSGILPAVWKSAWITPIFKKGDKCVASNYRPVSLTCVACKLLEHILCSEIRKFLDEHGILTPHQHGFRKFFSCESQLLVTTHDLLKRLDVREEVDIAILDFSKAFDVVPHKRLLRKLRLYGIEGRTLQWISNFLIGRTQSVMVNGVRSHSRSPTDGDCVLSGVPQGTVMGPLLFLLYVNDLPSVLDPATACRLFADDCLIYRSIKSLSDHVALQKDLESLHRWGETWGLKFNVSKCNIMHLSRKSVPPTRFYTLGGEVITSVSESKYLGVTFSNNYGTRSSQWKSHISQSASKANQRLAFLRRNLGGVPLQASRACVYFLGPLHYGVLWGNMGHNCQGGVW